MKRPHFLAAVVISTMLLAGCTARSDDAKTADSSKPGKMPEELEPIKNDPPADCPVTASGEPSFEAPAPYAPAAPWPNIFWFGSESLWTALQANGVWEGLPHNPEGYTQKIMWWSSLYSLSDEPEPALVVTGQRLDAAAPPLKFYGATNASAADIGEAMLTGVDFPTAGCWMVTGQYKKTGLSFTVWITP